MRTSLLYQRSRNLGDDMQTLAVRRLLSGCGADPDGQVPREGVSRPGGRCVLPMAAWWKFDAADWPPSTAIVPIPMGVHLCSPALVDGHEDWWRRWEPIGCRDRWTAEMLLSRGIEAWWSGCATLTLGDWSVQDWRLDAEREERLHDAPLLPLPDLVRASEATVLIDCGTVRGCRATSPGAVVASHQIRPERAGSLSLEDRLYLASRMAMLIWMSHTVVTTRLHAYLPAVAMGRAAVLLGAADARTADYRGGSDAKAVARAFRGRFAERVRAVAEAAI